MTTLEERAATAAGRAAAGPAPDDAPAAEPYEPAPDPMADYEPGKDDPEDVPVHVAWLRVRREIRSIAKGQLYNQSGTRFNFRGVDTVVQHFGPVTLKHGVHVLPVDIVAEYGEKSAKSGSRMRECSVTVTWQIMGPRGDTLTLKTSGEALDLADKATTKAQSVALRTLLLTAGLTPTGDPDPDSQRIERGDAPLRPATSYRDEVLENNPSKGRMAQMLHELRQHGRAGDLVQNEVGNEEPIGDLIIRIGRERGFAGGGQ